MLLMAKKKTRPASLAARPLDQAGLQKTMAEWSGVTTWKGINPMKKSGTKGDRLGQLTEICLALPEAMREIMGDHAAFTVRNKKFVYYLHDHHGDGIISVCFKTEPGENEVLLASDTTRFYSPAYIGPRGWVGLRLDVGKIDWRRSRIL